jgi:hypothetical protein
MLNTQILVDLLLKFAVRMNVVSHVPTYRWRWLASYCASV